MNSRRKSDSNASCHNEAAGVEEVCTGFLLKSPPSRQIRNMKSWKRRFFVLSKTNDCSHELKYYKSTERDKPIKSIEASTITMLQVNPEASPVFEWICKTFKCSPYSVLFMKTENPGAKVQRDFFFIGDTSEEVERWFNVLFRAIKNNKFEPQTEPQITTESNSNDQNPCETQETKVDGQPPLPPRKKSASEDVTAQCRQPPKSSPSATPLYENLKKEEPLDENAVESNEDMSSGESVTGTSEDSMLDCVTKAFNNIKTPQTSTESDGQSETHTLAEKEICISHLDANSLVITEEEGKPCVSKCGEIPASCQFHKGDQILAVNDLLTDTVKEVQTYLRRLSKSEVKLTIRRLPDSIPLHSEPC
ncbi:pleckstrin homology domain-containing family S member 1-like [Sinocyclocheilus rhinocerous]|uniref:pleckstrin homology domain-containing family S member 1-like n=1 Tax=Sinocyclocheilus rhinocerous TaxID=307959 RepID=UPI0007B9D054|nr:PREDICTED: pleckstrin homology domain-containing family S member 1-like [Sinocyclocheilus rhinocerous]XP_016367452.1 PREDICTED: pleckstrin homology domain-containing family S member 1-like [Sinocyclocheilus rhinocerous]